MVGGKIHRARPVALPDPAPVGDLALLGLRPPVSTRALLAPVGVSSTPVTVLLKQ